MDKGFEICKDYLNETVPGNNTVLEWRSPE